MLAMPNNGLQCDSHLADFTFFQAYAVFF